jgi:hypothetical protein
MCSGALIAFVPWVFPQHYTLICWKS